MPWQEKLNVYLTPKRQRFVLIGLIILYALLLTYKINGPFIGTSEAFTGMYGIAAWNWLVHGPIELRFAMMTPYGAQPVLPEITKIFFLNHPSFFIAPTALLYWLFGVGEWQTRASPIIFSLLSLVVFWALIQRVFKMPWLTAVSSFFYIFFPMGIFYGRMLTHDPIAEFFILALFLTVILFEQEQQKKYLVAICITTFLGGLADWGFLFAAGLAWWYVALRHDYPKRKVALSLLLGISAASLGVTLIQIWSITHMNPLAFLAAIFFDRNAGLGLSIIPLFLIMRTNFDLIGFSEIGLALAVIGAIYYVSRYKNDRAKILFAILLAGPGLLTYLIFYGHATVHQFMGLYLIPPVALAAGIGLSRMRTWQAGAVFFVFVVSCLWYAGNLFAYQSFALDDFVMLKRVNAAVPSGTSICMGENAVNTNIKFYLFPRQIDDAPCPNDSYFVLRQPQSYGERDPSFSLLQTFFANDFWYNLHRVSFVAASGVEIMKSVPFLKHKLERVFANHDPHTYYAVAAQHTQEFIDQNKLRPVDCSTDFCLYKKK